jgi:hypothetical protein
VCRKDRIKLSPRKIGGLKNKIQRGGNPRGKTDRGYGMQDTKVVELTDAAGEETSYIKQ